LLAFVLVHWGLGWVTVRSDWVGRLVKGKPSVLYAGGERLEKNMREAMISEKDLMESVRLRINSDNLAEVREIMIERSGEVSVTKDQAKKSTP